MLPVPIIPDIHRTLYAAVTAPDARLDMASWHTCKTTHCRAGWTTYLAGDEGRHLEQRFGTLLAAMMIYDASDPNYKISPCRFFDTGVDALEDMRKLAQS